LLFSEWRTVKGIQGLSLVDDQFAINVGLDILSLLKATCFPWKKSAEKQIHIYHYLARVPSGKLT
jgi:hypothetical protein